MSVPHDTLIERTSARDALREGRFAMTLEPLFLYCPACARECLAEAPPCPDGHGASCPDRACVECGTALMLDAPLFEIALGRSSSRALRRHAA
jgi:hypothetical protein